MGSVSILCKLILGRSYCLVIISALNAFGVKANENALVDIPLPIFIVYATAYFFGLYLLYSFKSCLYLGTYFSLEVGENNKIWSISNFVFNLN